VYSNALPTITFATWLSVYFYALGKEVKIVKHSSIFETILQQKRVLCDPASLQAAVIGLVTTMLTAPTPEPSWLLLTAERRPLGWPF
jgi:hypothetical protein